MQSIQSSNLHMQLDHLTHQQLLVLFGPKNENLQNFQSTLEVSIKQKGSKLLIKSADSNKVENARIVIENAVNIILQTGELNKEDLHLVTTHKNNDSESNVEIQTPLRKIIPANEAQAKYIQSIRENTVTFGIGPAGTGKTALSVAMAVEQLVKMKIQKIILVRPAVEAGEHLGHLPGDLKEKVEPYHRPIMDALNAYVGSDRVEYLTSVNRIEIGAVAYMRGRTLNSSFIIFDEAQNATFEQIKMIVTRLGFGSKMVVTGDPHQSDLAFKHRKSEHPLMSTVALLSDISDIGVVNFREEDCVRHPLVKEILSRYKQV